MKKVYVKPEGYIVALQLPVQLLSGSNFDFVDGTNVDKNFVDPDTEADVEDAL